MRKDIEAEVKRVRPKRGTQRPEPPRDKTMTGGEKMETNAEKKQRRARQPKEAPIIEKEVT